MACTSCHTCFEDCGCQGIHFSAVKILGTCLDDCRKITGVAFAWAFEEAAAGVRKPATLPANPRFEFRTLEVDSGTGRHKDCDFSAAAVA